METTLCWMINIEYSCVVATSFMHRADIWGLNFEELSYDNLWLILKIDLNGF